MRVIDCALTCRIGYPNRAYARLKCSQKLISD